MLALICGRINGQRICILHRSAMGELSLKVWNLKEETLVAGLVAGRYHTCLPLKFQCSLIRFPVNDFKSEKILLMFRLPFFEICSEFSES